MILEKKEKSVYPLYCIEAWCFAVFEAGARFAPFPVNYIDRQLRKDLANHVRETVCFTRKVNNGMERLMIYVLYHNHCKDYREGNPRYRGITHAEMAGLEKKRQDLALRQVFTRRKFLSLETVTGEYLKVWKRELVTPLREGREYLPQYALG